MKPAICHPFRAAAMLAVSMFATTLSAAAADATDGFVEMFNGKDLTGWQTTGNWIVEEGNVITLQPRPGESGWRRFNAYLTTERQYGDFVLDLEFKIEPRGNSGVFMRIGDPADPVESGFELQILDTHGLENPGHHDCGGIIRTQGPSKNMAKPAGEWNRYIITLQGSHLNVVMNGEEIQNLDLSQSAMKDRPAKGYISFQDEAKRVWYRNVRIKELGDGEKTTHLFNGRDFDGWVFDHEDDTDPAAVWSVADGVIACTGTPKGVLRTAEDFSNYELTFSWRWAGEEAGNSGLLIHSSTPVEGTIWPKCLEVQLQHGRAGDFILLGETIEVENQENRLQGRRISRTIRDGVENPVGEWNTMTARVEKDTVVVDINGKRVNEGENVSATSGAICFQSEGAPVHFKDIVLTKLD